MEIAGIDRTDCRRTVSSGSNYFNASLFLSLNGSSKAAQIAQHIGLSTARTRVLLAQLAKEERIQPEGEGRSRRYALAFSAPPNHKE